MKKKLGTTMIAALAMAAAGCGGGGGEPATSTTAAAAPIWNPCEGVPDDLLRQAGLDPSTETKDIADTHFAGWEVCNWKPLGYKVFGPKGYIFGIKSTNRKTLDDIRKDSSTNEAADITIGGRPALQFNFGGSVRDEAACDIAIPNKNGVVLVDLLGRTTRKGEPGDPCAAARDITASLISVIPS